MRLFRFIWLLFCCCAFFFLSYILPQRIRVSRVCTRYVFQHNESCTFVVLLQRCLLPDVSFYTERMCLWDTLILRQHVTTGIMVTFKYSLFTFTTMVNLYPTMHYINVFQEYLCLVFNPISIERWMANLKILTRAKKPNLNHLVPQS